MRPVIQQFAETFLWACTSQKAFTFEQFVPDHLLAYQISGETHIIHQSGEMVLGEGQVLLAQRNQFAKSFKIPGREKEYQCLSLLFSAERLRQFALDNGVTGDQKYKGAKNVLLPPSRLLTGYFLSVLPYVEEWKSAGNKLVSMKANEAIELILRLHPELKSFLFDFTTPRKTDLEEFMLKNFHYNAPIENFAKLSGRSLAAFKRDFMATFNTSPANWLKNKRLSEAYNMINQKSQKPADIYMDLGFENLSHFYTAFKKKFGMTPAQISTKSNASDLQTETN